MGHEVRYGYARLRAQMPYPEPSGAAMKRRKFLALLGGAAVAHPLAVRAQQGGKLPTVAFVFFDPDSPWKGAFIDRLRELGWIEGRNVAVDYRWSAGRQERVAEFAAELVQLKV